MSQPEAQPEKPFEEPWQAKAFALAVHLSARGLFTWPEWAQRFTETARRNAGAEGVSEAEAYWRNWAATLERIIGEKGYGAPDQLDGLTAAWREAFETTPHGKPVELQEDILVRLRS